MSFSAQRYALARAARNKPPAQADVGARIAQLEREINNLADAIASGLLRAFPILAQRLAAAEAELQRLKADQQPKARIVARLVQKVGERFLAMVDDLEARLGQAPERSRLALVEAIGDRNVLKQEIMVAGA